MTTPHAEQNKKAWAKILKVLDARPEDIQDLRPAKAGMTNDSFAFVCRGSRYMLRFPGQGSEKLIDRRQEWQVYQVVSTLGISDPLVYLDPDTGLKLSRFLENARNCDAAKRDEVALCMAQLRRFHQTGAKVGHRFDMFQHMYHYQSLWNGKPSRHGDHQQVTDQVLALRPLVEKYAAPEVLCHIDAVPDNFLLWDEADGAQVRLIDWEYAGMQDPHVDLAMFALYAMYSKEQLDELIDLYFAEGCPPPVRAKIYGYMAIGGLLWSNWCEYKEHLGMKFGPYSDFQYQCAKEYSRLCREAFKTLE